MKTLRKCSVSAASIIVAFICMIILAGPADSARKDDWITGLPREPIHVKEWPGGKKLAVCFVLYVEVWGHGQGPNLRPDTVTRKPDVVNESFRQYAITSGIPRVGRVFNEQHLPLSIGLNALFPEQNPDVWKQFRSMVPNAPIIAHGINNSTELLPLRAGLAAQEEYVHRTLDIIEKETGVRPRGWTSPSVYPERRHLYRYRSRRYYLFARRDGLRHPVPPRNQIRSAGPDSISDRNSRHGTVFSALEECE